MTAPATRLSQVPLGCTQCGSCHTVSPVYALWPTCEERDRDEDDGQTYADPRDERLRRLLGLMPNEIVTNTRVHIGPHAGRVVYVDGPRARVWWDDESSTRELLASLEPEEGQGDTVQWCELCEAQPVTRDGLQKNYYLGAHLCTHALAHRRV